VTGQICSNNNCICPAPNTGICNNTCTDLTTNQNCGTCGTQCTNGQTCLNSTCQCPSWLTDTSCGGCTNRQWDVNNCGTCGTVCSGGTPFCVQGTCASAIEYDHILKSGVAYVSGNPEYDDWKTFLNALTGNSYTQIVMHGGSKPDVVCNTPSTVNQITSALHAQANSTVSFSCNSHTWYIGPCGNGTELSVDYTICQCSSNYYDLRPLISSYVWGGIGSYTCQPPTQEIAVVVQ
jgi:hypothetical protein